MLKFFRENTKTIGLTIVILFGATMFSGLALSGYLGSRSDHENAATDLSQSFANLGNTPVNSRKYMDYLNQSLSTISEKTGGYMDPDMMEVVQLNALTQAIQYTIFLEGAKQAKLKVSDADMDRGLDMAYRSYNVKGKKELKELLKKNNYKYATFLDQLEEEMQVQKMVETIQNQITISDQDVLNQYKQIKARHILIGTGDDTNEKDAKAKITEIAKEISQGKSFEDAAKDYSQDPTSAEKGGDLGWLSYGSTVDSIENALYSLEKGQVSQPVKTAFGYHLVKVDDSKQAPVPADLDMDKEKERLKQFKQSRALDTYLRTALALKPLMINDPMLQATHAKRSGKIEQAMGAYQTLISNNPQNPLPHYYLATLYQQTGQSKEAFEELQKAEIKADLNPSADFMALRLELGNIYGEKKDYKNRDAQFQKAVELAGNNPYVLRQLEGVLKEQNQNKLVQEVQEKLKTTIGVSTQPSEETKQPFTKRSIGDG